MARMFPDPLPQKVRADRARRAEVRLYDLLARQLPADARVFHSVAWLGRGGAGDGARDGEADFVIVAPRSGVLVLEVKGGGIERDGHTGQWWSTSAGEQAHAIHDPFEQARRSKYALVEKIRDLPAFRDRWINVAHAVAFPDIARVTTAFGPDAPPEIVVCGDDLERLNHRIQQIYEWSMGDRGPSLSAGDCAELERLLAPRVQVRQSIAVASRRADEEIVSLTEDQYSALDLLSRVRRVAVSGAAGSGKTLLAVEQARRLAAQGFRTLFVCFNQPLAARLADSVTDEPRLEVRTFHDYCRSMAVQAGLLSSDYVDDAPTEFFERLPGLLLEALGRGAGDRFDAVVVDEAQDFEAEWWALLELAMADPKNGILFVFHDESQRVRDEAGSLPADLTPISLTRNLRNTRSIHALAQRFGLRPDVVATGPAGQPVELVELTEGQPLLEVLGQVIDRLIREEGFRAEEITILSGRGRASTVLASVERLGRYRCGLPPTMTGVVAVDTIRRFKGLDSRVVVLVEVDGLGDAADLLYVGITRARTHLVVVGAAETLARCRD